MVIPVCFNHSFTSNRIMILTAPLKWTGDISARYMGARPVLSPEFMPIRNLPTIIISYELKDFEKPKKR